MTAVEVEIDVELLKSEIKKTYASVPRSPSGSSSSRRVVPGQRTSATRPSWVNVREPGVESFAGVANPRRLGRLAPGEGALDLGSGAGPD